MSLAHIWITSGRSGGPNPERNMDYDLIEELGDEFPPLEQAKLFWRTGHPIPADLAVDLMQRGYDVQKLEDQYSI